MVDSTSETQAAQELAITDVLKQRYDWVTRKHAAATWHVYSQDSVDAWSAIRLNENVEIADWQHAMNRILLRCLGRTESNATAMPDACLRSNHYADHASRLEARVREFLSYTEDWDGEGAEEIPLPAIYSSLNFLDEFRRRFAGKEPRSAAPSPDGEIVLYWHGPAGYAEINFDGDGKLSMCWGFNDDEIQLIEEDIETGADPDASQVWNTLSKFLEQGHLQERDAVQEVL